MDGFTWHHGIDRIEMSTHLAFLIVHLDFKYGAQCKCSLSNRESSFDEGLGGGGGGGGHSIRSPFNGQNIFLEYL